MEYIGTIFTAAITFVLGYVLGRIKSRKRYQECSVYELGKLTGECEGYNRAIKEMDALLNKKMADIDKQKENEAE